MESSCWRRRLRPRAAEDEGEGEEQSCRDRRRSWSGRSNGECGGDGKANEKNKFCNWSERRRCIVASVDGAIAGFSPVARASNPPVRIVVTWCLSGEAHRARRASSDILKRECSSERILAAASLQSELTHTAVHAISAKERKDSTDWIASLYNSTGRAPEGAEAAAAFFLLLFD